MASAGRILIMPKGDYDANTTYEMLDLVNHNNVTWLARKTATGIEPSTENHEYWQRMFMGGYVSTSGAIMTGDLEIARNGATYRLRVGDKSKSIFQKNANEKDDYGTTVMDTTGDYETILSIQNGKVTVTKRKNGVVIGTPVTLANITDT